ncbi:Kinesin, motor domain-containing protein [Cynara cardunculus var. scolymus]|uniref:Kinesin-like protein n=1 Tax=Cynara cardunculus var. scolymus TaxID=59895 RepID=A0A103XCU1_CYNCS|nr:Kinesin, motor domain-containing protein [Cynara cardunculus var. scolymus]
MASRNQNKPPAPRSPLNLVKVDVEFCSDWVYDANITKKNRVVDEAPFDKRRKIGTGRMMASTTASRGRQALAPMNNQKDVAVAPSETEGSECENIEFTKEEVDALLNERFKGKKFDSKGKQEWMTEYMKKLKFCIKWFQKVLEDLAEEKDNLRKMLDSSEKKCMEAEAAMKSKEEELNTAISKLETNISSLKESLANEESEKINALECHKTEKEARMASEKNQDFLKEELGKAEQNVLKANEKVKTQEDMYKRLQEYNTSLQQYNTKLQNELKAATDANKQVEREKAAILENHSTLRGHYNLLQKEFTSAKDSRDDAMKQKEAAVKEVDILRGELQQVREDRERQLLQVQGLTSELIRFRESTGRTAAEVDSLHLREQISVLQHQLAAANQKLKVHVSLASSVSTMADLSSSEIRTEYEEQKRIVSELQDRLRDSETQLLEGERLRKKLHNTILELKGNIRVFCRVRPLLPDDGPGAEASVCYPTSVESAGRGIDLVQSGQKYPFTFDKVFAHDASQQEVFMEISQLVQSALDGYKVCIFAYGQTGSGKTYTMMGRPEAPQQKGLIPRSLEQASMLEIYNETIRDLLSPRSSSGDVSRTEIGGAGKQYVIRHDADGNTYVSDLTIVDSTEQQVQGVLNLIDLAGSERLSRSGATGERLKETQAINKSLSSLSDVIFSLAKKEDHPCLGGDSKTLMFVNVSPDPSSVGESLCSLRFAARVNSCEIGIPRRQTIRPLEKDSRMSYG